MSKTESKHGTMCHYSGCSFRHTGQPFRSAFHEAEHRLTPAGPDEAMDTEQDWFEAGWKAALEHRQMEVDNLIRRLTHFQARAEAFHDAFKALGHKDEPVT